jgi:hypothetical protein
MKASGHLMGATAVAGAKNFLVLLRGDRLGELGVLDAKSLAEKKAIKLPWCEGKESGGEKKGKEEDKPEKADKKAAKSDEKKAADEEAEKEEEEKPKAKKPAPAKKASKGADTSDPEEGGE